MKTRVLFLLTLAVILAGYKKINDVITDVGSTLDEIKHNTLEQIANKEFNLPYYTTQIKNACKKLPVGVREATMMSLGNVVKEYVESPQFQNDYFKYLETFDRRRSMPSMNDEKWADEKKKKVQQMVESMSNQEILDIYAQSTDAQIEAAQSMLDLLKESPDLNIGKKKEDVEKELADAKMLKELYTKDKEAFKKKYAEITVDAQMKIAMDRENNRTAAKQKQINELKDYKSIIRKELQQFLSASANVDFDAELVKKGNKMVFVNPVYESKPLAWKLCFRSGKEAVTGARKFAQNWLNNLK